VQVLLDENGVRSANTAKHRSENSVKEMIKLPFECDSEEIPEDGGVIKYAENACLEDNPGDVTFYSPELTKIAVDDEEGSPAFLLDVFNMVFPAKASVKEDTEIFLWCRGEREEGVRREGGRMVECSEVVADIFGEV